MAGTLLKVRTAPRDRGDAPLFFLGALILTLPACTTVPFTCVQDAQCVDGAAKGFCESNHHCSFTDAACPSRRRYAPLGDETCVALPPPCSVTGITAGYNNVCAWFSNGKASCWGEGTFGQLGEGSVVSRSVPKVLDMLNGATAMDAGGNHTCALLKDGTVSCWGENTYQQLGDGTTIQRSTPIPHPGLKQVVEISAGGHHGCARLADNSLVCFGRNNNGQVGDGAVANRPDPVAVSMLKKDVAQAALGDSHSCALMRDGAVFCWGNNRLGAVGPGAETMQLLPFAVPRVPVSTRLSAGDTHTCALAQDGTVT